MHEEDDFVLFSSLQEQEQRVQAVAQKRRKHQRALLVHRRDVDEKCEQLRSVANSAALIAGFSVVVLTNINQSSATLVQEWLLTVYALTSVLTVCLMTHSFLSCTLMLVGILKKYPGLDDQYDLDTGEFTNGMQFTLFWKTTCEQDWNRAYRSFTFGVPSFLMNIIVGTWVKFLPQNLPGALVTAICTITIIYLFGTAHLKWGVFVGGQAAKS